MYILFIKSYTQEILDVRIFSNLIFWASYISKSFKIKNSHIFLAIKSLYVENLNVRIY